MSRQRYRITVTPIESDGRPCTGRCTIEFEQRSRENWMRELEALQGRRELSGDECAALTVGTQLLKELADPDRGASRTAIARLEAELRGLLERLDDGAAATGARSAPH